MAHFDSIQSKWRVFIYNFSWPNWVWLIDGPVSRYAFLVPIIGYLIIFNDYVSKNFDFKEIAGSNPIWFILSSDLRLKFIYFGLIFLGIGNIFYHWWRPAVMALGRNHFDYAEQLMQYGTASTFVNFHEEIRYGKFDSFTGHGEHTDEEWSDFLELAIGVNSKNPMLKNANYNWQTAKHKHESMLRSILIEIYFRRKIENRIGLMICIALSVIGYILLLVPSIDLFLRILSTILFPATSLSS